MTHPVAVYDASVLYPSLIRNLLMHLAATTPPAARCISRSGRETCWLTGPT